jgi:hypothetical protein
MLVWPEADRVEGSAAWKIAGMFLAGYFEQTPCFFIVRFFHFGKNSEVNVKQIDHKYSVLSGSDIVRAAMYRTDKGQPVENSPFAQYVQRTSADLSLDGAERYAKGYVEACSSPLALQMDEAKCRGIGGHIHVAELTKSGFRWRIAPK